jgi:hypothetical protein
MEGGFEIQASSNKKVLEISILQDLVQLEPIPLAGSPNPHR